MAAGIGDHQDYYRPLRGTATGRVDACLASRVASAGSSPCCPELARAGQVPLECEHARKYKRQHVKKASVGELLPACTPLGQGASSSSVDARVSCRPRATMRLRAPGGTLTAFVPRPCRSTRSLHGSCRIQSAESIHCPRLGLPRIRDPIPALAGRLPVPEPPSASCSSLPPRKVEAVVHPSAVTPRRGARGPNAGAGAAVAVAVAAMCHHGLAASCGSVPCTWAHARQLTCGRGSHPLARCRERLREAQARACVRPPRLGLVAMLGQAAELWASDFWQVPAAVRDIKPLHTGR
eukprot:scaffold2351_cov403-Prasinococcus_capsulatus_cf.AAC.13